jgi:membrane protein implicated in regulation of membrane protease activity
MFESLSSIAPEIVWAILGIIFIFIEFFIPGLVIAFFGVGALITALTTLLDLTNSIASQLLVFIVSTILLLVFLRKYVKNIFLGDTRETRGKKDALNIEIGKIVPVVELIQPGEVGGRVRYQGSTWAAKSNETIAPGESVKILGCENITLIVERVIKEQNSEEEK